MHIVSIDIQFIVRLDAPPSAKLDVQPSPGLTREPRDELLQRLVKPEIIQLSVSHSGDKPERPLPKREWEARPADQRVPLPRERAKHTEQAQARGQHLVKQQSVQRSKHQAKHAKPGETSRHKTAHKVAAGLKARSKYSQLRMQTFQRHTDKLKLAVLRNFRGLQANAFKVAQSISTKTPAEPKQQRPEAEKTKQASLSRTEEVATKSQLAAGRHVFSQRQTQQAVATSRQAPQLPTKQAASMKQVQSSSPQARGIATRSAARNPECTQRPGSNQRPGGALQSRFQPGMSQARMTSAVTPQGRAQQPQVTGQKKAAALAQRQAAAAPSAMKQGRPLSNTSASQSPSQATRALPSQLGTPQMRTAQQAQPQAVAVKLTPDASPATTRAAMAAPNGQHNVLNQQAGRLDARERLANEPGDEARYNRVEGFKRVLPELKQAEINLLAQQFLSDEFARAVAMAGLRPGSLYIDTLPVLRTEEHVYSLYIAIDLVTRFAHVSLVRNATAEKSVAFLQEALELFPFRVHEIVTANNPTLHAGTQKDGRSLFLEACASAQLRFRLLNPGAVLMRGVFALYDSIQPELAQAIRKRCGAVKSVLQDFLHSYNHLLTQKDLNYKTPRQLAASWYTA